jgi:hypothetical protein
MADTEDTPIEWQKVALVRAADDETIELCIKTAAGLNTVMTIKGPTTIIAVSKKDK